MDGEELAPPLGDVFMKNGDIIQCVLSASDTVSKSDFHMVHNYRVTATQGQIATWADAVANSWENKFDTTRTPGYAFPASQLWGQTTTFSKFSVYNVNTPDEQASIRLSAQGSINSPAYDPRSALLMRLSTGLRGKSYNGHLYYPPPCDRWIEAGIITRQYGLRLAEAFANAIKVLGTRAEQGILTVYSRKLSTDMIIFNTAVSKLTCSTALASQRRRREEIV